MLDFNAELLHKYAQLIKDKSGIYFHDSSLEVLQIRIHTKLKATGCTAEQYFVLLQADENELASFIDNVTTNYTGFFRHQKHFDMLDNFILPTLLLKKESTRRLRVWSAGCSSGEEAYSLAIVILEHFLRQSLPVDAWKIEVIGSDLSLEQLMSAKTAVYPKDVVSKVPAPLISKYFTAGKAPDTMELKDPVKRLVSFDFHNLIYPSNISGFDIVLCRNVLIYFDTQMQKEVISHIQKAMNPHALLILGLSETMLGLSCGMTPHSRPEGIVYEKP